MKHKNTILLHLSSDSEQVEWVLLDANGNASNTAKSGNLSDFAKQQYQGKLIVLFPSSEILITYVNLPKMSRNRLAKAIPYSLEEKLISSINLCYFAIGSADGQSIPVAVIKKELFEKWMLKLKTLVKNSELELFAIIPDVLALPIKENAWSIYFNNDSSWVRTSSSSGFYIHSSNLLSILILRLDQIKHKPAEIRAINATPTDMFTDEECRRLAVPLSNHKSQSSFLASIKSFNIEDISLNLLQGDFQLSPKVISSKKLIKYSSIISVVALAMLLLPSLFQYLILTKKNVTLQQQISRIYFELFPNATAVVSPELRVDRLMKSLSNGHDDILLGLLSQVVPEIQQSVGIEVKELVYFDQVLQLRIMTSDFALLDQLLDALKQTGLSVEQTSANKVGTDIVSDIQVKESS